MDSDVHIRANPIINVCGKRILDYVAECLAKFNRGANRVTLRTLSGSESTAVEIAHILRDFFGIEVDEQRIKLKKIQISNVDTSSLEIPLRYEKVAQSESTVKGYYPSTERFREGFIEFIVYNLLFDSLLAQKGCLDIAYLDVDNEINTLRVFKSDFDWKCQTGIKSEVKSSDLKGAIQSSYNIKKKLDGLAAVYYRCGLLLSDSWKDIATKLSWYDDAILGLDTNILYDSVVTGQLLPSLTILNPREYIHTPNWLLIIIPSSVMHEIEQAANYRDEEGNLLLPGRIGYRGLQEILELDSNTDLSGVSLLIVGEANPVLDTRIELQGLRQDLVGRRKKGGEENRLLSLPLELRRMGKISTGDTIIRDQFRAFLRQVGFHKASYFLTADKSHAALARAEGLHAFYYKRPSWHRAKGTIEFSKIPASPEHIELSVPIGKLIYELAVQFGTITVRWSGEKGEEEIRVTCDTRAETLDHWIHRELRFEGKQLRKLLEVYRSTGRFVLSDVVEAYNKFNKMIEVE